MRIFIKLNSIWNLIGARPILNPRKNNNQKFSGQSLGTVNLALILCQPVRYLMIEKSEGEICADVLVHLAEEAQKDLERQLLENNRSLPKTAEEIQNVSFSVIIDNKQYKNITYMLSCSDPNLIQLTLNTLIKTFLETTTGRVSFRMPITIIPDENKYICRFRAALIC